ncbi:MAG: hypothetical protein Kow0054_09490 [Deferrisoma sp.]
MVGTNPTVSPRARAARDQALIASIVSSHSMGSSSHTAKTKAPAGGPGAPSRKCGETTVLCLHGNPGRYIALASPVPVRPPGSKRCGIWYHTGEGRVNARARRNPV